MSSTESDSEVEDDNEIHNLMNDMVNELELEVQSSCYFEDNCNFFKHKEDSEVREELDGVVPLHKAVIENNLDMLEDLLQQPAVDLNYKCCDDNTALLLSVKMDCIDAFILRLIEAGCDLDLCNCFGKTPLLCALLRPTNVITLKLLQKGVDLNVSDGENPLQEAIIRNNSESICMLLYFEADTSSADSDDFTVFMLALHTSSEDICRIVINYCHDISQLNSTGCNALHYATLTENPLAIDIFKRGADMNVVNDEVLDSPVAPRVIQYMAYDPAMDDIDNSGSLINQFYARDLEQHDRLRILYLCLQWSIDMGIRDLASAFVAYRFNEEFEALFYCVNLKFDYGVSIRDFFRYLFKFVFFTLIDLDREELLIYWVGLFSSDSKEKLKWIEMLQILTPNFQALMDRVNAISKRPSLVELSRDQTLEFIRRKYAISRPYQFYDIVKKLNVPRVVKEILLFRQPVY